MNIYNEIKQAILDNSIEKNFGCIHCKEDSERCVDSISLMVDDIVKVTKMDGNILHRFFNYKSDANKYLTAEQQEDLEKDFTKWMDESPTSTDTGQLFSLEEIENAFKKTGLPGLPILLNELTKEK